MVCIGQLLSYCIQFRIKNAAYIFFISPVVFCTIVEPPPPYLHNNVVAENYALPVFIVTVGWYRLLKYFQRTTIVRPFPIPPAPFLYFLSVYLSAAFTLYVSLSRLFLSSIPLRTPPFRHPHIVSLPPPHITQISG